MNRFPIAATGLVLALTLLLSACGAKTQGTGAKVGMHIDAALEFAIEYPLNWEKIRTLPYRSGRGEVRWSDPAHRARAMIVSSEPAASANESPEQHLETMRQRFPGLELTLKETKTFPAGEALHVMGFTSRTNIELYLFSSEQRRFAVIFTAPAEEMNEFSAAFKEIIESFLMLSSSNSATT